MVAMEPPAPTSCHLSRALLDGVPSDATHVGNLPKEGGDKKTMPHKPSQGSHKHASRGWGRVV